MLRRRLYEHTRTRGARGRTSVSPWPRSASPTARMRVRIAFGHLAWLAWALLCWVPWVAAQQTPRTLPPTDDQPRTRAEWEVLRAWEEALSEETWREIYPHWREQLRAMRARTASFMPKYLGEGSPEPLVYDVALAEELVSEFYVDQGHPRLNSVYQDRVMDVIREVASWPPEQLPPEPRRILLAGMLEYVQAGGGQYTPATEARAAETLLTLAPDDEAARRTADMLLEDAFGWTEELGSGLYRRIVYRHCARHWGDVFWLRLYEAGLEPGSLPEKLPKRYRQAVAALANLLAEPPGDEGGFARRVHAASKLALGSFDDRRLENDLTSRLLIVYRCLLARRPAVPRAVSEYIEDRLVWLAAKSRRLRTDVHWQLWGQAGSSLRAVRISERFKSYVRTMLKAEELSDAQRRALRRVADSALLFRDEED